jgi:UDPglucose 6-dehydrogenase
MTIGFIGQGWIGKNYADSFEDRGFSAIRYALEEPFVGNKERIAECDIVFIAVPTPTTPQGFTFEAVRSALSCVGKGKIAVIKSTLLPGTTRTLQTEFPEVTVLFSPEFLREVTARNDVDSPDRNIVGITAEKHRGAAETVLGVLPKAPYTSICTAEEAELTKYAGNTFLYLKVVYMNMLYDLAHTVGSDWEVIAKNIAADSRIGTSHLHPVHASGHASAAGRGAGGHCFIKDFAAFAELYRTAVPNDIKGVELMTAVEQKNIDLLRSSHKDEELLQGVYGA